MFGALLVALHLDIRTDAALRRKEAISFGAHDALEGKYNFMVKSGQLLNAEVICKFNQPRNSLARGMHGFFHETFSFKKSFFRAWLVFMACQKSRRSHLPNQFTTK